MIWIATCLPETRLLPLEEIEAVFGNPQDTMMIISTAGPYVDEAGEQEKGAVEHIEK